MAAHYPTELLAAVIAAEAEHAKQQKQTKTQTKTATAKKTKNARPDLPSLCATGAADYDSLDAAGDLEFFYETALLCGI